MLPQHFLNAKLHPPRLGGKIMPRPRLIDRMYSYLEGPATIVSANAGCGKTTLVADFVQSCRLPSVWYQIDASDDDLDVFFGYLAYGLQRLHPEFGGALLAVLRNNEGPASKADQLADVFTNEVEEHIEQRTILVMDDFHHIDHSTAIGTAVDRLMRYLPDVLHIILTSRTMPNLSVSRLRSKGLVGIIDRRDLLFRPQETQQLFADTFQCALPEDLIKQIQVRTEGWITALQLIRQSLDRVSDGDRGLIDRSKEMNALEQSEADIFDYFAEEVMRSEPPDTQQTLGRLALFERISPEVCESVFQTGDCRDSLRMLSRRNVFIAPILESGEEEEYRLHSLFRSFLKRWLVSQMGADQVSSLHKKCADYFAGAAQWDLALHHYSEAEAGRDIADLLSRQGAQLVRMGRFELIKRAFASIPQELLSGHEHALIARADVAAVEGDRTLALELFERAANLAEQTGAPQVRAESLRGQAYLARRDGQFERAVSLASEAIKLAPELHSLRARCFNIIGICRFNSTHDAQGAVESWRSALEEARQGRDDQFAKVVLHNLGLPYSVEGDLNEAIYWTSQMLDDGGTTAEKGSASPPGPFPQEAIAHLNLARLKMAQGRLDESQSHLELALQRCKTFNLGTVAAETLEAFGNLYRERGDYAKSLEFYGEAERAYREAGLPLTARELLDERAALFLQMGQTALAERDMEMYCEARCNGSPFERTAALIARGRVEMAAGRSAPAEAALVEAVQLTRSNNLRYFEARATTTLARLYWDGDRQDQALAQLARAVELSLRYDYSYWLTSEAAQSASLVRAAARAGIAPDYLERLLPAESPSTLVHARPDAKSGQPSRSDTKIESLIEGSSFDLTIKMLGSIEILRSQDEPMPEDAWRLWKSLHILCYIASRRNHRVPKETLIEVFWPEADAETIARNFHPMISHARKALNHGQVIKKNFILYRDGAYFLNPQYRYDMDIESFERLLGDAAASKRHGDADGAAQLIRQAVALYRGEYLEGLPYEWVDELRNSYRALYLDALKDLAGYSAGRGDHEEVVRYGQMILQRDPYREDVHCQVMEAYVGCGNRAAAIEQFNRLRKLLRSELGVAPLPATVAKYESLIK